MHSIEMVAGDLYFPEGPRWRPDENKLYFSDVMAGKVSRVGETGVVETVFRARRIPQWFRFSGQWRHARRCHREP
ncbi:MAG: hypothetical protein CM1200mP39_14930 [Dehalococcoidia bacterium]|nr:MAG: hypothetical protein CM1200mP39_14930 [Dehalococcoidia bacterium]